MTGYDAGMPLLAHIQPFLFQMFVIVGISSDFWNFMVYIKTFLFG